MLGEMLHGRWMHRDRLPVEAEQFVASDSRAIQSGGVFVAYSGVSVDGHQFIDSAIASGAAVLVVEDESVVPEEIPALIVPDGRSAISQLSAYCYGYPTRHLKTYGITGTNGKTTSLWLLSEALKRLGERVVCIGTLGAEFEGKIYSRGERTTPTAEEIHRSASEALAAGATACVMEVSSHALHQKRASDVCFDGAVFTNLTPDHMDYHRNEEEYLAAKQILFELTIASHPKAPLVAGTFDSFGKRMNEWASTHSSQSYSFGRDKECSFSYRNLKLSSDGISAEFLQGDIPYRMHSPLIGEFNGENLLGVFSLLVSLSYPPDKVLQILRDIPGPSGRMERFSAGDFTIFVDYAHVPEALQKALLTLRPITKGNLWVLFGSGGGKDPRRRAGSGTVAKEYADKVVLTSDNPRLEDPMKIIDDILESGVVPEFTERDRAVAIARAVSLLAPGDILLIAGKGHENFQIMDGKTFAYSDQDEVLKAIGKENGI